MKQSLEIFLASSRGFCFGVERAINVVEDALKKFGTPLYVFHDIVHNVFVVDEFKKKGVIFVNNLDEVPNEATLIFSAHGVSQEVEDTAHQKKLNLIDATCPLVKKVHNSAQKYSDEGRQVIIIGHKGHVEVEGTAGRASDTILIDSINEIPNLRVKDENRLAFVTQTTLNVDDTAKVIDALKKRFPNIVGPELSDICHATKTRQSAVKDMLPKIEALIVIGSKHSSNSTRLKELGTDAGIPSFLINGPQDLDLSLLKKFKKIGITAGASAPEVLVKEVEAFLAQNFDISVNS